MKYTVTVTTCDEWEATAHARARDLILTLYSAVEAGRRHAKEGEKVDPFEFLMDHFGEYNDLINRIP